MNRKVRIIKGCYEGRTGNIIKIHHVYALVKLDGFNKNIAFLHKEYEIIEEQKGTHMAKDCYLEIDGKRTKLTDEQLKALGLYEEPKENPFERTQKNQQFYYINLVGEVAYVQYCPKDLSDKLFDIANYCTDKELLQQRSLHEILNRLLWRFSMQNDGDKIDWNNGEFDKWFIYYENNHSSFTSAYNCYQQTEGTIYFHTKEIAQRAIDEIVIPFMKEHPDFIW